MGVTVEFDSDAQALYLRVNDDGEPFETSSLSDLVLADLDETGGVVGIEILKAPADITAEDLDLIFGRFPALRSTALPALSAVGVNAA
jgi:uncharacterized protein YuzE